MEGAHPVGRVLEWLFARLAGVRPVSDGAIFRYAVHAHRGTRTVLADGTVVEHGDMVLELHLDNARVREIANGAGNERRAALELLHASRRGMEEVAALARLEANAEVKALFANTPRRFTDITSRLGFEQRALAPTMRTRAIARLQRGALRRYDEAGMARVGAASPDLVPVELWMSRAVLAERHGGDAVPPRDRR